MRFHGKMTIGIVSAITRSARFGKTTELDKKKGKQVSTANLVKQIAFGGAQIFKLTFTDRETGGKTVRPAGYA